MRKMNKKGLVFKDALFAIIFVSVSIIAIGVWIGDWNIQYNSGLTYDLGTYDELRSVSSTAQSQKGNLSVKSAFDAGQGATNFEGTSIRGAFGVLNNIFTPFRVVFGNGGMIDSLTARWGLPDYIGEALLTIMIISLTWALIAIFFRKPGGKA